VVAQQFPESTLCGTSTSRDQRSDREINEVLARKICRDLGVPEPR
jgi:hypothetical protein